MRARIPASRAKRFMAPTSPWVSGRASASRWRIECDSPIRMPASTEPQTFTLDHGYCKSLDANDPNGLIIELTVETSQELDGQDDMDQVVNGFTIH